MYVLEQCGCSCIFFSDGALFFFLILFVIFLAGRVSVFACTHVHMCAPIILAGCRLTLIYSRSMPAAPFLPDESPSSLVTIS